MSDGRPRSLGSSTDNLVWHDEPGEGFAGCSDSLGQIPAVSDAFIIRADDAAFSTTQADPPVAKADGFTIEALGVGKKGVRLDILANDEASTRSLKAKSIAIVEGPDGGRVTISKKGVVLYKPDNGFQGEDTFSYTVKDKSGLASAPAIVSGTCPLNLLE